MKCFLSMNQYLTDTFRPMYKIFLNSESCKNRMNDKQCLKVDQEVKNGLVGWHVGKVCQSKSSFRGWAEPAGQNRGLDSAARRMEEASVDLPPTCFLLQFLGFL